MISNRKAPLTRSCAKQILITEGLEMKRQKSFAVIQLIAIALVLLIAVGWVKNIIKLSDCDFEAPYKAEVIHTLGIIPFVGMVTGWLDVGR